MNFLAEMKEYLKDRADVERDYAKKLENLGKKYTKRDKRSVNNSSSSSSNGPPADSAAASSAASNNTTTTPVSDESDPDVER